MASHPDRYPGLLESSAPIGPAAGGRFDLLPISSGEILRQRAGSEVSGPHSPGAGGFLAALEDWWQSLRIPAEDAAVPFSGGWLVYLSYETAREIEPSLSLPPSVDPVGALAIRAPAAWIRDRRSGHAWVVAEPGFEPLLERFEEDVSRRGRLQASRTTPFEVDEEEPDRFTDSVRRALEYIAAGDVYQANLSRGWHGRATSPVDPAALYRALRAANPSPFAALLRDGDFAVISSSPERLVSVHGGIVSTRPIAGTRPRGTSPERDAALIESLLGNEKERAEHVMLIDLERNDLGRICVGGSVRVDEYMTVESYAHVHHIVSNVSGLKLDSVSPVQTLRAMFPGGTITGCPKVRCMQIIAELEGVGRGAYTGAIGYINRDGSCDFNILIRTITAHGGVFGFRAGAGIVADSNPSHELAETRAKAEGMLRALRATQ
ncbi:MAG TPA: aminodeoxychorismate synthase component I [Steroidobacteraceae bacterium]|nr:aminodeoxychorismate synthase component I [Steroidobacteraceae bacterium]